MSIKAGIYHLTHYKYDNPVRLGPQIIRLKPAAHSKTKVISHSLKVSPENHFVNLQQDPYGNYLARYVFPDPVTELKIEVDLVADMTVYNPFDFFVEEVAEHWPFDYPEDLREDLDIYRAPEPMDPALEAFMKTVDRTPRQRTVDMVVGLNARLQQQVGYVIRMEPGVQTPEETLTSALGSCRDSSWLLVQIAAQPRLRGPLRLRLPHPARARPQGARRPVRHRGRLHRPARLVRGLSARRRLDRP
jgi:transglutaminase-like putative cysteine protease